MVKIVRCTAMSGHVHEIPSNELQFRPSVYAVIVKDGKVLLGSQWDGWDFPGGHMQLGETIEETLTREVKEETGLTVKKGRLLHVGESFFTHPDQKHYHTILLYYSGEDAQGELSTEGLNESEKLYVRDAQWIPLDQTSSLKFYNQVDSLTLIRLAAEGRGI